MVIVEIVDPAKGELKTTLAFENYVSDEQLIRVIDEAEEEFPGVEGRVRRDG